LTLNYDGGKTAGLLVCPKDHVLVRHRSKVAADLSYRTETSSIKKRNEMKIDVSQDLLIKRRDLLNGLNVDKHHRSRELLGADVENKEE
jgi:hypothetical protein